MLLFEIAAFNLADKLMIRHIFSAHQQRTWEIALLRLQIIALICPKKLLKEI